MHAISRFDTAQALATAALALVLVAQSAAAVAQPVKLEAHRAVYDMTLDPNRKSGAISAAKGRMVYEITGSACEGYTQNMRFVTQMVGQDGQPNLTDLRSSTFEDGAFKTFRFSSSTLRDERTTEAVQGDATRGGGGVKVDLTKPEKKTQNFAAGVNFPVQHSVAIIDAARAGQTSLRVDLYDGSDKGEKIYDTKTIIGARAKPDANSKLPALKGAERLDTMPAWPVSVSYYEMGKEKQDALPSYELSFLFFENGVSRKIFIDYGEFALRGELKDITFLDTPECKTK